MDKNISLRGRTFTGTVTSARMQKTVTVEWTRRVKMPKYERYTKRRSKVKAHNPDEIKAEEGDIVRIMESRRLSKTKNFVVIEKLGKEKGYQMRKEALELSKKPIKEIETPEETQDASSQS